MLVLHAARSTATIFYIMRGITFAAVAVSAAAAVSPPMSCANGALDPRDGFLQVANLSLAQAEQWCVANASCAAFTTRSQTCGTTTNSSIHTIYFTEQLGGNTDRSWRTWQKPGWKPVVYACLNSKCAACPGHGACAEVTYLSPNCFGQCVAGTPMKSDDAGGAASTSTAATEPDFSQICDREYSGHCPDGWDWLTAVDDKRGCTRPPCCAPHPPEFPGNSHCTTIQAMGVGSKWTAGKEHGRTAKQAWQQTCHIFWPTRPCPAQAVKLLGDRPILVEANNWAARASRVKVKTDDSTPFIDPYAPVPPYPPSPLSEKVRVSNVTVAGIHPGDTWPSTWGQDGAVYLAGCDNHPDPEAPSAGTDFFRLTGSPEDPSTISITLQNPAPVTTAFCRQPAEGPGKPGAPWDKQYKGTTNVKSAGLISVNGTLYLSVQCQNFGDNPTFNRQHNVDAWIVKSEDQGKTWQNGTEPHSLTRRFTSPCFVQQGQDHRLSPDGLIYMHFPAAADGKAYWCQNDGMLLARAQPSDLLDYSKWEVVVSLQRYGMDPVWRQNAWDEAIFTFSYPLMTGENGLVTWNPVLERYFLPNYSFIQVNRSTPLAWHNSIYEMHNYHHRSQITIFEAENPWGPWRLVWRDDDAERTFGLVAVRAM